MTSAPASLTVDDARAVDRRADRLATRLPGTVFIATAAASSAGHDIDVVRLRFTGPPINVIELAHVVALRRLLHTVRPR